MGRVAWNLSSQLPKEKEKDSRNNFYRPLRRHQHEAIALYLESLHYSKERRQNFYKEGCRTKTGITKKLPRTKFI